MNLTQKQLNDLILIQDQSKWTTYEDKDVALQHPFLIAYRPQTTFKYPFSFANYILPLEYGFMLGGQAEEFHYFLYKGNFFEFLENANTRQLTSFQCYEYDMPMEFIKENWAVLLDGKLTKTMQKTIRDIIMKKSSHQRN